MSQKRKIAVITTSRADYGHLFWPLKRLLAHKAVDLRLIVLGAHLSPEFGGTITEIERDGFPIDAVVECLLSSDSDVGMAKTIGLATLSLADRLSASRPDILLLIADRYEMLAPASVALALRIPIAHIEGGEVSEGAIDDAVRNAITKMSHLHFTPTALATRRVLAMGEEPWRVHQTGAPSLDHLRHRHMWNKQDLATDLGVDLERPTLVVAYHPVTLHRDTVDEADAVFAALGHLNQQLVFCFPNADAGSRAIVERARQFIGKHSNAHIFVNLNHLKYWSLLHYAELLIGNSSSGIMETPSLALATVNIGDRQRGRERAPNIIDAAAEVEAILNAVERAREPTFKASLGGMVNPYGDGHAAERIVDHLTRVPIDEKLLRKKAVQYTHGRQP